MPKLVSRDMENLVTKGTPEVLYFTFSAMVVDCSWYIAQVGKRASKIALKMKGERGKKQ